MKQHFVYILASQRNGTLYIGVTTDLLKRMWQHKNKAIPGFTAKYNVNMLVHYEVYDDYWIAANRERQLKNWKRKWKLDLIEKDNPEWNNLHSDIVNTEPLGLDLGSSHKIAGS